MYRSPVHHVKLLSSDGIELFYPRRKLVTSCKFFRDVAEDFGEENIHEFDYEKFYEYEFSAKVIESFLYFMDHEKLPEDVKDLNTILSIIRFADHVDYDNAGFYADKHLIICSFMDSVMNNLGLTLEYAYSFAESQRLDPDEWMTLCYTLTHQEEWKKFAEGYVKPPPAT